MDSSVIIQIVSTLIFVLTIAILIRSLMSWFPMSPQNPFYQVIYGITDPIIRPLQRIVPKLGMIDISPMVALIILWVIQRVLSYYA